MGGVVFVALVAALAWFILRRRKRKSRAQNIPVEKTPDYHIPPENNGIWIPEALAEQKPAEVDGQGRVEADGSGKNSRAELV